MPNNDKVLKRFKKELDNQIQQKTDPLFISITAKEYSRKHLSDEDLAETKGFFNGLKVTKEMLDRIEDSETKKDNREHISLPVPVVRELIEFTRDIMQHPEKQTVFSDWKDADDYLFASLDLTKKDLNEIYDGSNIFVYYNSAKDDEKI